ncbi:aminotransferase class IV [Mariprofundus sp. NF]|uniref:aminotransferase class IV n=1 Tax=Mariprofundus sp. NF TaxID=2608716 RepID=UPI0015A11AC7|nr:aminotransferase class IV [Mariprofundus sp. NF]NWF39721.1 aminotransferase class IV [Mariprofundus sp. NF]
MKIVKVDQIERGMAYAEACFETFRVIDGHCFAWPAHQQRLAIGLSEFGIELADDDYRSLHESAVDSAAEAGADALVRVTVTGGEAGWGLINTTASPSAYIQSMAFTGYSGAVSLRLKRWPFPLKQKRAKFCSDYAETLRALKGSKDIDLLFERDGLLIAAATANLLLYRKGRWWTPVAGDGVLPGVVRGALIEAGVVAEAECPVTWLNDCEAVALTNSGQFVRRVAEITDIQRYDGDHHAFSELTKVLAGETGTPKDDGITS